MDSTVQPSNPFDMLINPQAILLAVERSNCLRSLKSKICRPLDMASKPSVEGSANTCDADVGLGISDATWPV